MIYVMQRGDICVVEIANPPFASKWLFAEIIEHGQDAQDNWEVAKVRVVGESFDRDDNAFGGIFRISNIAKQQAAKELATLQHGNLLGYKALDEIKKAILNQVTARAVT